MSIVQSKNHLFKKSLYSNECLFRVRSTKWVIQKMTDENVETMKADAKKLVSDVGNIMSRAKADVEMMKSNLGHKADTEKKSDATRISVTGADTGARPDSDKKKADAKVYTEDARETVESIFGVNAGIVWKALNLDSPMTIDDLVKATALNPEEIYCALGWLGRESKISLETRGNVRLFSLRS